MHEAVVTVRAIARAAQRSRDADNRDLNNREFQQATEGYQFSYIVRYVCLFVRQLEKITQHHC